MARTFSIPLGVIPQDAIESGINAAGSEAVRELRLRFAHDFSITEWAASSQYESTSDSKSVVLVVCKKRLTLRRGFFHGVDVNYVWHRRRPNEVKISTAAMCVFLEKSFWAMLVIAGIAGVIHGVYFRVVSEFGSSIVFFIAFGILLIPYFIMKAILNHVQRDSCEAVAVITRSMVERKKAD